MITPDAEGHRLLVCAPFGRDAASVVKLLRGRGFDAEACADLAAVAARLDERVGVVLLTEEALASGLDMLRQGMAQQPAWSDVPFILLAARTAGRASALDALRGKLLELTGNAIVLERPLGFASLVSATASAMRARRRQFEMRDQLLALEAGRRALAASEAELRLVADSLPVLIGFVDQELIYRFANRAYEDWLGLAPEAVVGRPAEEVLGAAMFAERGAQMRRALAGEPIRLELPWPHLDGSRREADVRYLPRSAADGRIDGFHVFAQDITERKEAAERLEERVVERTAALRAEMASRERAEAALRQSQKMEAVGQLTGGLAHDFNNMLTGIIGVLDLMRRRIATGETQGLERFMDAATTSAQRAARLTERLLAFSRRQSLDPKPLDANRLVRSLEELLRQTLRENISLEIVTGEEGLFAVADANQLENAILNLAINARDAMPDGGRLTVETSLVEADPAYVLAQPAFELGRYVAIKVSDTGVGMTAEVLEKVFDPFFTTKPIGQGTGLGLSMVYGFVRQSGGQVRVHSKPGLGTTVSLFLAAAETSEADEKTAAAPAVVPEGRGQTVLLVEDDPSVRLLVREVLKELRYATLEAEEANAAIPILLSNRTIDLMISDVGLPGMNGRQLADYARERRPELPVLFITGYAENAAVRSGFLGPNMDMITKPFALDTLGEKISAMLAGAG